MPIAPSDPNERRLVSKLAALYLAGDELWDVSRFRVEDLEVPAADYKFLLGRMADLGFIADCRHTLGPFSAFRIDRKTAAAAREIEAEDAKPPERKDMVESIKFTIRRHPIGAATVMGFAAVLALATLTSQILAAVKNAKDLFGW